MRGRSQRDPPFQGGAQPVPQRPGEIPKKGRAVLQTVVIVIAALVALAALLWLAVPLGS